MRGKVLLLAGAAVGYVLGSKAGRQRYEQIKSKAEAMWHEPAVQEKVSDAEAAIQARVPEVQHKLSSTAGRAAEKVKSTVKRDHGGGSEPDLGEVMSNDEPPVRQ